MSDRPWEVSDMGDLSAWRAIVTGSTSGIGLETARVLAEHGATVILAARNELKAAKAAHDIRQSVPADGVTTHTLDLADLASIHRFSDAMIAENQPLDLLVNNGGVMLLPYGTTPDGFEQHFGTNHLGHFALTGLLLPLLEAAERARVVTVSSLAHREGDIDFDDLHNTAEGHYNSMAAYRRSKFANVLFALELDRRLRRRQSSVSSLVAHPGLANTGIANHLSARWWWRLARPAAGVVAQSAAAGALPPLRAATDPQAGSGQFYGPSGRRETRGAPVEVQSSRRSLDQDVAEMLWTVSEELTGVSYL